MSNNKKENLLFNQHFLERGGLYISTHNFINSFVTRSNNFNESLKDSSHLIKKPPKIIFNVINNPRLNACASIVNDNLYLIGINAGVFFIVDDLCRRILSYGENLIQIGNPLLEFHTVPSIRNYYCDAKDLVELGPIDYGEFPNLHPKDKVRDDFAALLLEIILEFIYHHELAHILNGHLKIKRNTILDHQTLEMDADCAATSKVLAKHIRIYKGVIATPKDFQGFYNNIKAVIFCISYALVLFNRITADYPLNKNSQLTDLSHSKPRIRQIQIGETILRYFDVYFKGIISSKEILETFAEANVECEKNYMKVTGEEVDILSFEEAGSDRAKIQVSKLMENWDILKLELKEYSYVELA